MDQGTTYIGRGIESVFSTLGTVFDGAQSLLGDYLEYDLLKTEVDAQKQGLQTPTPPQTTGTQFTTPNPGTPALGSTSTLTMIGLGLAAIAVFSLLTGK